MQQPPSNNNYVSQPSFNKNYMQQPPSNNNYVSQPSFNKNYMQQPPPNAGQFAGNHNRYNAVQHAGNQVVQNVVHNPSIQNVRNQNRLIVVPGISNQNGNGNVVAARAEGNGNGNNWNQIRCYNYRGSLIAQKKEAWIQLQAEENDLMAYAGDIEEIKEVNVNCILMANLQQASSSGTQADNALIYDSDGSAENDNNVISADSNVEHSGGTVDQNLDTVEATRAYFESLYNNLVIEVEKVNTVNHKMREANAELTTELVRYKGNEKCFEINQEKYDKLERCYQKSVYQEQCITKKINALHLSSTKTITTLNEEIANLNNQLSKEKSTISYLQEERKKLKTNFKACEDEFIDKLIQAEKKIKELDNILVKTGQSIQTMHMLSPKPDSFYHTEQKMALGYQNPFYLKKAQKKQQSLYNGTILLDKHDPPVVYDSEETLQLAQESRLKMKQLNKEIKPTNYVKINQLSEVFVSQKAKSREELYFLNTSKTASVSYSVFKPISIPDDEFSDNTSSPSVARKFLNEVKGTIVNLQRVVKQKMIIDINNWSSAVHQEFQKILKDEIALIINQVDARIQNFEIQFLKGAAKFVRDFKSLAKEADESLDKNKVLEYKNEHLLRAVVSQDIMAIMQNNSVVDTSNLQTELDRTKEKIEMCIIKKEKEYVVLWNNWYKKCEESKYDKILYDKYYNDMQHQIKWLQAQLVELKGTSMNTQCASNTLDPLSQKLDDENVALEFQVKNLQRENEHLKSTYKNLFDSIKKIQALIRSLGWHLEEIHVTWAHLEKKQTRLRLYTIYLEELCIKSVETASRLLSDGAIIFKVTAS
ncbi:hypothetical protein Tco_0084303 [Tanacetum coccineum]